MNEKQEKTQMMPSPEFAFQRRNKGIGVQVQLGQTADLQP